MIASIAPEPETPAESKGSSRTKEIIFFFLIAGFILLVLMLPSLAFIYATKQKPSLGNDFSKLINSVVYELTYTPPQENPLAPISQHIPATLPTQPNQPSTPTYPQVSITQSITDEYNVASKKLLLQTYPAECNVGKITGDFVQFNSVKCYTEKDIELLRGFMQNYFSPYYDAEYKQNVEQTILRIISRGKTYPPVQN